MAINPSTDPITDPINKTVANKSVNNRRIAIALAFAGALPPLSPFLAWAHKFYLGQYLWGVVYLALAATPLTKIVWIACALEGVWYLTQSDDSFTHRFPMAGASLSAVGELATKGDSLNNPLEKVINKAIQTEAEKDAKAAQAASQVAAALRDLDQLRQDGLMTEYEFEQKRRKLLEKIG
ncbi:MAG: SHOCT domain-containing protein [Cyanobacteria bacterium J06598_3]